MTRPRRLTIARWALVAAAAAGVAQRAAWAATSFTVVNNGMSTWLINGQSNPTLSLTKGQTYNFVISDQSMFGHPFWIATQRGAGDTEANQWAPGVTNNGAQPATTLTFTVPASAPAMLFYQCSNHDTMGGTLNIVAPAVSSVPATGRLGLAALGGGLLLVAARIMRHRQKTMAAMRDSDQ